MKKFFLIPVVLLFFVPETIAQTPAIVSLSLTDALNYALEHNEHLKADQFEISYQQQLKKSSTEIPKTALTFTQGQFNSVYKYDNSINVNQSLPFPSVFSAHTGVANALIKRGEYKLGADKEELIFQIKSVYHSLQYHYAIRQLLQREDSIYGSLAVQVKQKYEQGGGSLHEKMEGELKVLEMKNALLNNKTVIASLQIQLRTLLNHEKNVDALNGSTPLQPLNITADSAGLMRHPHLKLLLQESEIKQKEKILERNKTLPDLVMGYFNLSIYGPANIGQGDYFLTTSTRMQGFTVGLNVPLWLQPHIAKIKAAEIGKKQAASVYQYNLDVFEGEFRQTLLQYQKCRNSIDLYKQSPFSNSSQVIEQAFKSFSSGGTGLAEYLAIVSHALQTETNYLNAINENNQAVVKLEYLMAK